MYFRILAAKSNSKISINFRYFFSIIMRMSTDVKAPILNC